MQRLLIIEDETTAYQKLIGVLQQLLGTGFDHDWAKSVKQTTEFTGQQVGYDLIIADIQLSDGLSLTALENQGLSCPIIFCSAYNDYLMEAFQTNGIAYILKPYQKADIKAALDKYDKLFTPNKQLLTSLKLAVQQPKRYKQRLVIKGPRGIQLLFTKDISLIEAQGDFCRFYRA
ncbi:MAG: response regulator, partial [Bacteroidota bacterium]